MDSLSLQRAERLHPKIKDEAIKILAAIDKATTTPTSFCRYAFTLRTIKEQDDLFALGRTKVNPDGRSAKRPFGNTVTNARGGFSFHNYGLAIDIAFVVTTNGKQQGNWNTKTDWDKDTKADWLEVVEIFRYFGWEWGDRGFVDLPHFQKVFNSTPAKLLAKVKAGKVDKAGYVIL